MNKKTGFLKWLIKLAIATPQIIYDFIKDLATPPKESPEWRVIYGFVFFATSGAATILAFKEANELWYLGIIPTIAFLLLMLHGLYKYDTTEETETDTI